MADTTTTLNVGSGGDKMDESSVLQADQVTSAKRPRVVIGGDAGHNGTSNDLVQPVKTDPGASAMMLPVLAGALVSDTPTGYNVDEIRALSTTTDGCLRVSAAETRIPPDLTEAREVTMWGQFRYSPASPWEGW